MSTTARAALLVDQHRPRPYRDSRPIEIAEISLDAPGPGEVQVRIASTGLCHSDLSTVDGTFARSLPLVLGHEAAGTVEAVGAGVEDLVPGDKVVFSFVPSCGRCTWCAVGRPALCEPGKRTAFGGTLLGGQRRLHRGGDALWHHLGVSGFAERTICAQESLVRIPPDTPLDIASLFGCAALTGLGAVFNTARVEPGASVAIFGAGGVGLMALLGAIVAGATQIVVVDPVAEKRALATELGATHAIDPARGPAAQQIQSVVPGGVAYAFEAAGSAAALEQAYNALAPGGAAVAIGLPRADATAAIGHSLLVREERQLRGSFMGSSVPRRDIPRYIALWRAGRLPVERLVSRRFALDELNDALDALAAGDVVRAVCTLE